MKKRFESFSGRLTRKVVFTVLATMTIISVLIILVLVTGMLVFSKKHYSDIMDKAQSNLSLIMSNVEVSANNIIDEIAWHLFTPEVVMSTLEYELNTNRNIYGCGMAFVSDYFPERGHWFEPYAFIDGGEITIRDIGSENHDYFNAEWYKKGLESAEGVWSNPYLDEEGAGAVLCTYSRQVSEPEGEIAGVFGADLSLEGLSSAIMDYISKENEGSPFTGMLSRNPKNLIYCFIIGPDGDYIVHPDRERILRTNFYDYAVGDDSARYRKLGDMMRAGETGNTDAVLDGIRSKVYFTPLLDSGWSMGIAVPTHRLLMPGFLFAGMIMALILLGLLIVFLICKHSIKKTSKPLIQLAESAGEVAQGNFDTKLPQISTNDEIRLLRDSFDNMQKSLAQYVDELTETTAQKASMESELEVARSIQMSMLPMTWPAFPERDELDIFGSVTPAKAVGGDLYDFCIREGKLFFCIGDVSGKGIPASLVMTVVSSMFRTLSASMESPAEIVSDINASMSARNDNMMFVTLFVGAVDLSTGELEYSNAGHNAPVIISGGEPHLLEVDSNVPVGIIPEWKYSLQRTTLYPDRMIFLYTDGLNEATRIDGQLFGEERMLECLSGLGSQETPNGIILKMTEAVNGFVGDAEQSDDLTMLAVKLLPKRSPDPENSSDKDVR